MSTVIAYSFPFAMAMAAFLDVMTMKIPNRLVIAFFALFFVAAPVSGMDVQTFGWHFAAFALCLAVSFALFIPGWIGGGDAKFFAVAALWVGWDHLLMLFFWTSVFGGVLAIILVIARQYPMPVFLATQDWIAKLQHPDTGIPYGVAMAIAGILIFSDTRWAALAGF